MVKQERCNDARWSFQHITSISQSGKTVDAGVNCLFFFFLGSRYRLVEDLVFPMMFFCLFYETLQLHIIPIYLHSTSHAFVLTFKVSRFFFPYVWGGIMEVLYLHLPSGWVVLLWLQPVWSRLGRFFYLPGYVRCDRVESVTDSQNIALRSNATFLPMLKNPLKKHGISKRTRTLPYKVKPPSFIWRGPMIFFWRRHVYTLFGAFSANEKLFGSHQVGSSLRLNKVVEVWFRSNDLKTSWWQVDSLDWTLVQVRSTKVIFRSFRELNINHLESIQIVQMYVYIYTYIYV